MAKIQKRSKGLNTRATTKGIIVGNIGGIMGLSIVLSISAFVGILYLVR